MNLGLRTQQVNAPLGSFHYSPQHCFCHSLVSNFCSPTVLHCILPYTQHQPKTKVPPSPHLTCVIMVSKQCSILETGCFIHRSLGHLGISSWSLLACCLCRRSYLRTVFVRWTSYMSIGNQTRAAPCHLCHQSWLLKRAYGGPRYNKAKSLSLCVRISKSWQAHVNNQYGCHSFVWLYVFLSHMQNHEGPETL